MIIDGALAFDNPSSLAIGAGTQASANTIDLLNARDIGMSEIAFVALVGTAFATGAGGTLQWSLQGSVDNSAWTTMASSRVMAVSELGAGAIIGNIDVPIVSGTQAVPRYLRVLWTVGTGAMSAGTVMAFLVLDRQRNIAYAPGVTVTN